MTAANESWKPTSSRFQGFMVSSTAAGASTSRGRSVGRDARPATVTSTPATPARTIDGAAPVTST